MKIKSPIVGYIVMMVFGCSVLYLESSCGDVRPTHRIQLDAGRSQGFACQNPDEYLDQELGGCVCRIPQNRNWEGHCFDRSAPDSGANQEDAGAPTPDQDGGFQEDGGAVAETDAGNEDGGVVVEVDAGNPQQDGGVELADAGETPDSGLQEDAGDHQCDGGDDDDVERDGGWCRLKHHTLPPNSQGHHYGWYKCHPHH